MANEQIKVTITADGSQVPATVGKVNKQLATVSKSADAIGTSFSKLGGVIGGALSLGAAVGFLKQVNGIADALNDMAQKMGASASGLQALQVAAAQAGGTAEGLNVALSKMSATLGDAMAGNKQAVASIERLGLSISDLSQMKADEAFRTIADRIAAIPNAFERASAAQDIFGKGAKDIAGLLAEGGSAIDEVNRKLDEQGARLSDLDVAKIGVMNDELQFQQTVVTNLGTKFLSGLTPAIGVATGAVAEMLGRLGGATEAGKLFGTVMVGGIKVVETAAYGLAAVFETVRATISGMLAIIAQGIADLMGGVAGIAERLGFDWAAKVQTAATTMDNIAGALQNVSDEAKASATQAASYAIEAAVQIVKAGEIFNAAQAEYERKAAEAATRNAAAQGTATLGTGGAYDPNVARMAGDSGAGTSIKDDGKLDSLAKDPTQDPKYLYQQSLNAAMLELQSADAQARLNIAQATDASFLDSLLLRNDLMVAAEEAKNQTLGQTMGDLANMAIQQGGAMGKFGKAYAIASTVWSTGSAIMKAFDTLGPVAGIPAAAMISAKGAMQLANIKKTNIGSSGSIAGASGGGASGAMPSALPDNVAATRSTESDQRSAVQVIVQGSLFAAQETVDWLTEKIGEAVNNRDLVFINGNSRQAMELAGT